MKEIVDKETAFRKELWQSSADGRDFCEILCDKNSINLHIKRFLNLEQCTENHDNEMMNRRFVADNCCQDDTEFEETEHKLLLDNRARSEYTKEIIVSESCEKSDAEKELKEENASKEERKDKNRYEEMENSEDGSNSTVSENCDIDKSANETCNGQQEDMEKSETECLEKNGKEELDKISDDFLLGQNVSCYSLEVDADNAYKHRMDEGRKNVKLMIDDGKSEIESKAGQLDEVITESGFCEDFESLSVKNTDNCEAAEMKETDQVQTCSIVLDKEVNINIDCELKKLTDGGVVEEHILIKKGKNVGEVDHFSVIETELNELTSSSENGRNKDEENDWLRGGAYSKEDLIALTTEFQQLTFPFVNCADASWYEKQEKKWNNVSCFTVMDKGPG